MKMRIVVMAVALFAGCRRREAAQPVVVAPPSPPSGPPAATCPADTVRTDSGCVRGTREDRLAVFRGIPYAAAPIGDQRWRAPAPAATWSGIREATAFGKACPQLETSGGKLETAEDCLTLNIWAPSEPAAKLPVMVWIHGGGLVQGGSALPFYDGARLAADGVVVVTFNYRLGALGFLAHPALSAEDPNHVSGNFGLLDQLAALRWVKTNIGAFGGDANNVMIFGESAGGESVCALMASPLASGLFSRAAIESASCVGYGQALRALAQSHGKFESRLAQGERIAKLLGCTTAACLRGKSVEAIVNASPAALGFLGKGEKYGLAVDGYALTEAPAAAMAAGKLANVPLIVGTTADEATLFTSKLTIRPGMYFAIVARIFKGAAPRVLAEYSPRTFGSAQAAFDALVTDLVFTCPARRVARAMHGQPVYRYLFSHVTAKNAAANKGATHGSEIPFVFGTQSSPTAEERTLATTMVGYWTHFARTGDPNVAGAPAWPAYDAKDSYIELATPIRAGAGVRTKRCDLLDSVAPDQLDLDD